MTWVLHFWYCLKSLKFFCQSFLLPLLQICWSVFKFTDSYSLSSPIRYWVQSVNFFHETTVYLISKISITDWSIFTITSLKCLLDNSDIYQLRVGSLLTILFLGKIEIFVVLHVSSTFGLHPGHFGYYKTLSFVNNLWKILTFHVKQVGSPCKFQPAFSGLWFSKSLLSYLPKPHITQSVTWAGLYSVGPQPLVYRLGQIRSILAQLRVGERGVQEFISNLVGLFSEVLPVL